MERVTIRVPKVQIEEIERLVEEGYFPNRSEGIRQFIRDGLEEHPDAESKRRSPWGNV